MLIVQFVLYCSLFSFFSTSEDHKLKTKKFFKAVIWIIRLKIYYRRRQSTKRQRDQLWLKNYTTKKRRLKKTVRCHRTIDIGNSCPKRAFEKIHLANTNRESVEKTKNKKLLCNVIYFSASRQSFLIKLL